MAKKKDSTELFSGQLPETVLPTKESEGIYDVRSSVLVNIPAGKKYRLNTGVTVHRPVLVFERLSSTGLKLSSGTQAFDAGMTIIIELENSTDSLLPLDSGDKIARLALLGE